MLPTQTEDHHLTATGSASTSLTPYILLESCRTGHLHLHLRCNRCPDGQSRLDLPRVLPSVRDWPGRMCRRSRLPRMPLGHIRPRLHRAGLRRTGRSHICRSRCIRLRRRKMQWPRAPRRSGHRSRHPWDRRLQVLQDSRLDRGRRNHRHPIAHLHTRHYQCRSRLRGRSNQICKPRCHSRKRCHRSRSSHCPSTCLCISRRSRSGQGRTHYRMHRSCRRRRGPRCMFRRSGWCRRGSWCCLSSSSP